MTEFPTKPGSSFPLGATVYPEGVNFSIFSKGAAGVELLLFGEMIAPDQTGSGATILRDT